MTRGLLWLPLLIAFIWLAWSGWNEYQKLETYKIWAEDFDNAKFDIYAVLGKKGDRLTWGNATRTEITNLNSFALSEVEEINLLVDDRVVDLDDLPSKGKACLEFTFSDRQSTVKIPFTDILLAAKWLSYIYKNEAQKSS
ncbi:MAG: hypothetical protein AAGE96_14170 [Cyanobacteria bacterium P01_G01_bin.19]